MACDCRRPVNCYNDKTRYKTMVILYIIDLIFFIIRLSVVSYDISKSVSDAMSFLIPILLFDLLGSVPIIICNILYVIMRHCVEPLVHRQHSFECLWYFATMTCSRTCRHNDRPQTILLLRLIFISFSFILRFICFVIGASCAAHIKSQCTVYTVMAAFALVSSVLVIIVEFIHFFRLWNYNPTERRNTGRGSTVHTDSGDSLIEKTHRCHLRFVHYSLINDERSEGFRHSRCTRRNICKSQSLHHHLLYHSLEFERDIDAEISDKKLKQSFLAFHQTSKQEALDIVRNGFPHGEIKNKKYKDYLRLKQSIFFTPSCTQSLISSEAIICVRLNLGRVIKINDDACLNLNEYFGLADGKYDTVYVEKTKRFYLRTAGQIEKWIVTINADVPVNDVLDGTVYNGCL